MKILITGGTGFIGSNLVNLAGKRHRITVLSRKEGNGVLRGSLGEMIDLRGFDIVIHLAWSKEYEENLAMTKNLVESCKAGKIKKIILVSSMSAKRSHPDNYGKTKQMVEKIVKESGLNYTILRPSIVYGKGSTSFNFMTDFIKKLPFIPIIGGGRYSIYPVYVKDVVTSIEKCIDNKKTDGRDYDLPGGERIYFIEMIDELKRSLNIKKRNVNIPIFLCKIIAMIIPKILSKETIRNLTEDSLADSKTAREDFGYIPITFQEGRKHGII